ncbi:MAG: energy transducer TonB [Saprospiraceae bacterium]|jgi:TonB family protein|nr:energy transducer TonB [Saprospiraceae bacterium]
MEREKKPKHFIQQPEYPGGPKELTKFIYENLRYPAEAVKAKIEGSVYMEYDIDYRGNVVETRIIQSLGYGCDEEAARVVKMLKFMVGRNRGMRVLFHQKAHIRFKLPKPVKQPAQPLQQPVQVQYNYVTTPSAPATTSLTDQPKQQPAATTYSYSISFNNKG